MPSLPIIQANMVRGEISPRAFARLDLQARSDGMAAIRNMIVAPYGGIYRRPGTRFGAEVKNSNNPVHLIDFIVTVEQSYVVEAGPSYFRFFTLDGQLAPGGIPYEVVTPYTTDDVVSDLMWAQSEDVLFLSNESVRPMELQRTGVDAFQLVDFEHADGPYMDQNITATTLVASGAGTGSVTITASSTTGINDDQGWLVTDVGRQIRMKATNWTWLEITAFIDDLHVTATVKGVGAAPIVANVNWRLGAWSDTTGWPHTVTLGGGRIWFATTTAEPARRWSSRTFDLNNFSPTDPDSVVAASHGIVSQGLSGSVDHVHWLVGTAAGILSGGAAAEMLLRAPSTSEPLGPGNEEVIKESKWGNAHFGAPVEIGRSIIALQRGQRVIREYSYDYSQDAFDSADLSLYAEHLFQLGVTRIVYQQNPSSVLWALRTDGTLLGMTLEKGQKVLAWHAHTFAGTVESMAVVPIGQQDRLWLVVNRTINNETKRYVEFVEARFEDDTAIEDAFFVDCGLSATFGDATDAITGLDHLEAATVSILADGAVQTQKVVAGGAITLDEPATTVVVGLPQLARFRSLPLNAMLGTGQITVPKNKIAYKGWLWFDRTVGGYAYAGQANTLSKAEEILFRVPSTPMNQAVQPFTGVKEFNLMSSWGLEQFFEYQNSDPLPVTALSFIIKLDLES